MQHGLTGRAVLCLLLISLAGPAWAQESPLAPDIQAPEFPDALTWIHVRAPLRMADLRGRIVLLDFWTFG